MLTKINELVQGICIYVHYIMKVLNPKDRCLMNNCFAILDWLDAFFSDVSLEVTERASWGT